MNLLWTIWHKQKSGVRFFRESFSFLIKGQVWLVPPSFSPHIHPHPFSLCLKSEHGVWYCGGHIITTSPKYQAKYGGVER